MTAMTGYSSSRRRRRMAFVYDTICGLFAFFHADWLCVKFGAKTSGVSERSGRLFSLDKRRRFADALFDAGSGIWVHVEFQVRYGGELLLRMLEYKSLIHRIHGRVHLVQGVMFLRRPPKTMRSLLPGTPYDYGYLWMDLSVLPALELLSLGTPIATVLSIGCADSDREEVLGAVVAMLAGMDERERGDYAVFCRAMAELRPYDSEQFIKDMEARLEDITRGLTDEHRAAVRQTILLRMKKEGRKLGRKEGMAKGLEKGLEKGRAQERVERVLAMHAKGFSVEQIALAMDMDVEKVNEILGTKGGERLNGA